MTLAAPPWTKSPLSHAELRSARTRAGQAVMKAQHVTAAARRLIDETRALRRSAPGSTSAVRFFVLRGEVDGAPVTGRWLAGTLMTSPELHRRAELLVQLEERFEMGMGGGGTIPAGLSQPMPALLTLVRACDRLRWVLVGPMGSTPNPLETADR
jgi:hypothetical protein